MSNDVKSLEPNSALVLGYHTHPKDAAFLRQSLRQYLGINPRIVRALRFFEISVLGASFQF
jgi:hypothetical protein